MGTKSLVALAVGIAVLAGCDGGKVVAPSPTPGNSSGAGGSATSSSGASSSGGGTSGGSSSGLGGSASSSGSSGSCTSDGAIVCPQGNGLACTPGLDPANLTSDVACDLLGTEDGLDDYCCVVIGDATPCEPNDAVPCNEGTFGYSCTSGNVPGSLDSSLVCSVGSPDPDGYQEDFCCFIGSGAGGSSSGSGGGGGSSSGGLPAPAGCIPDPSVGCSGGATGFSCQAGDNPGFEAPYSCSTPTVMGSDDAFCCFMWNEPAGECAPDDDLTSTCPDADSYGYQCTVGDDPSTVDPSLTCSASLPDPDGVHDDFCCVYE